MTERLSSWDPKDLSARGIPSKQLINVYRRWGEGEFGVILTGNTMIFPDQLEAAGNPIIPPDAPFSGKRFEAFKEMGAQAKKNGSLMVAQLSHPGRQSPENIQKDRVSASDIQLRRNGIGMSFGKPHAVTQEEIYETEEAFAHAAELLYKAGYDGVQLHGAHSYLLSQFLSRTTNQRTDKYGGSLENRSRIIIETAQRIRNRVLESFIVDIKLNSVEFQDKGFNPNECRELCRSLEENKFDFVELSGGTYEEFAFAHKRESTRKREAFSLEFAKIITPALSKIKTYVTSRLRTVGAMVNALNTVNGIGLARPVCQEPRLPADILSGKAKAAKKQLIDENDFGLTNMAAGTQIRQIGDDQEPIDLSIEQNKVAFMKDLAKWSEEMKNDKEGKKYGYIDLSIDAVPFGTALSKI